MGVKIKRHLLLLLVIVQNIPTVAHDIIKFRKCFMFVGTKSVKGLFTKWYDKMLLNKVLKRHGSGEESFVTTAGYQNWWFHHIKPKTKNLIKKYRHISSLKTKRKKRKQFTILV